MKATGIIRRVDSLGRIVIPKELRTKFNVIDDIDAFEIFVDENSIILRKYQPSCIFCGSLENIITYKSHNVCNNCIDKLGTLK